VDLSNNIRRFRFENDEMTQKRLAARVGVSRQRMNAIENCQHAPKIDVAIRIADVFGAPVDEMCEFDYDGKPERRPIVTEPALALPAYQSETPP
jgi:putative transcriptional regulator